MKYTLQYWHFYSATCFWTNSRSELSNSKIYIRATYFDKKTNISDYKQGLILADTIIDNIKYRKFQTSDFTDYSEKQRNKNILRNFYE
jgi:hypothetical protein